MAVTERPEDASTVITSGEPLGRMSAFFKAVGSRRRSSVDDSRWGRNKPAPESKTLTTSSARCTASRESGGSEGERTPLPVWIAARDAVKRQRDSARATKAEAAAEAKCRCGAGRADGGGMPVSIRGDSAYAAAPSLTARSSSSSSVSTSSSGGGRIIKAAAAAARDLAKSAALVRPGLRKEQRHTLQEPPACRCGEQLAAAAATVKESTLTGSSLYSATTPAEGRIAPPVPPARHVTAPAAVAAPAATALAKAAPAAAAARRNASEGPHFHHRTPWAAEPVGGSGGDGGGARSSSSGCGSRPGSDDSSRSGSSEASTTRPLRQQKPSVQPAPLSMFMQAASHQAEKVSQGLTGPRNDPLAGHKRYRRIRDLSRGSTGFVQLCEDLHTRQQMAIKFIPRGPAFDAAAVRSELANQHRCRGHPHIVQLLHVFVLPCHLAIVMEYANKEDLANFMSGYVFRHGRGLPEAEARRLLRQLLAALQFAHERGVVNRDVKLDNILLHVEPGASKPTLKLCDWGFSKEVAAASGCKTRCGTPEYMAPEVLRAVKYDGRLADSWGVGVVMYVLLAGAFPFLTVAEESLPPLQRLNAMVPRIMRDRPLDLPEPVSLACRHLLYGMLDSNPAMRVSVEDALQHPWVTIDSPQGDSLRSTEGPKPSDTDCSIPVAWDLAVWAASNSIPPQLHRVAASEFTRMSR